jgi:hypothetical protein
MASIRGRLGQSNTIKVVASNSVTGSSGRLSDISDVDVSSQSDKFVMVYNANTNKYEFVDPDQVLVAAASTVNPVGNSGLPTEFLNALNTDPNRPANPGLDGGTW